MQKLRLIGAFVVIGFLFVFLYKPTLNETPAEDAANNEADNAIEGWQTYRDEIRGFSLQYPAAVVIDITAAPVTLPDAVGEKERMLKIDVMPVRKVSRDSDGCMEWSHFRTDKEKLDVNGVPMCLTVLTEAAAGSTYRTYHYTTGLKNDQVADITMTIRSVSSVKVYGECETDADQSKQFCVDHAFDEERDTQLFKDIIATFKVL